MEKPGHSVTESPCYSPTHQPTHSPTNKQIHQQTMNYTELLRQCVAYFSFAIASIFVLSLVGFLLRRQLRMLFDRWRALGRLGQCVTLVFVSGFVLYGGSKHLPPTQTNDSQNADEPLLTVLPPWDSPLVDAAACRVTSCDEITRGAPMTRQAVASTAGETSDVATFRQTSQPELSRWAARGAWVDWQRIEFPDGFAFPIGTNQITEVTLMSYGALIPASSFQLLASRSEPPIQSSTTDIQTLLHSNILTLPCRVSLEPGESSIHYGLTPSNSFLIAWENVCVERSSTNRVDASIELFRNGDTLVTIQPLSQPSQPSLFFTPAALPEGWVGEGQNLNWATNAFPEFAENIRTNGYANWLADYVGINEQNGRYKVIITIDALPEDGPCYLECGPYKVIVREVGVYGFPLEVCQHYQARTYPVAIPLTIEYDDGYRGEATMASAASAGLAPRRTLGSWMQNIYDVWMAPEFRISPSAIDLDRAVGTTISIWCNSPNAGGKTYRSFSGQTTLVFRGDSQAEIVGAAIADTVEVYMRHLGYLTTGTICIAVPTPDKTHCHHCYNPHCPCGGWCDEVCSCHASGTNGVYCVGDPDWTFPDF